MAAIAAANVTVTKSTVAQNPQIVGRKKVWMGTIAFGNGALTYPTGGIPLPAKGYFGLKRAMNAIEIRGGSDAGISWSYDATNHKLLGYTHTHSLYVRTPATADAAATSLNVKLAGNDLYVSQPSTGNAPVTITGLASGVTTVGGLVSKTPDALAELAATIAPASTTLTVTVWGW